jgi:hypothetical protein
MDARVNFFEAISTLLINSPEDICNLLESLQKVEDPTDSISISPSFEVMFEVELINKYKSPKQNMYINLGNKGIRLSFIDSYNVFLDSNKFGDSDALLILFVDEVTNIYITERKDRLSSPYIIVTLSKLKTPEQYISVFECIAETLEKKYYKWYENDISTKDKGFESKLRVIFSRNPGRDVKLALTAYTFGDNLERMFSIIYEQEIKQKYLKYKQKYLKLKL